MASWFVYMLLCSDNSVYTGITTNLDRRVKQHNTKKGAKAIFGKLPVIVVYKERHTSQKEAAKREREIKSWSHSKKAALIGVSPEERSDEGV